MTMHGNGRDIVLECNFCGKEVHRYKDAYLPIGLYQVPHKIICINCETNINTVLLTIRTYAHQIIKTTGEKQHES